jgi:hypothetical protein
MCCDTLQNCLLKFQAYEGSKPMDSQNLMISVLMGMTQRGRPIFTCLEEIAHFVSEYPKA